MAEKAKQMGLDVAVLSAAEAQELEPEIALDVLGGVHYKCDAHLYPNKLNHQLIEYLKTKGVRFLTGRAVTKITKNINQIFLYRLFGSKKCKLETDPTKADLFFIPMYPGHCYVSDYLDVCQNKPSNLPYLPYLNAKTASFHYRKLHDSLSEPPCICRSPRDKLA